MSWTCPKCERELLKENQWHNCVKVSLDSLFLGKPDGLVLAFDKILAEVADWDAVTISTSQNCIVFVHRQTFLIIRPMKKELDVKFYTTTLQEAHPIIKSEPWSGRYANHIRISNAEEVTPALFGYLNQSYKLL